ncbi:MAG: hypothetical protein U9N60_06555 [Thermodesulfobacteriota bacterium]|nr:hypothetical protein [Thermodesulfobacteriota bacterium]
MENAFKHGKQENHLTVVMYQKFVDTKSGGPLIAGRRRLNNRCVGKLFLLKKENEIA